LQASEFANELRFNMPLSGPRKSLGRNGGLNRRFKLIWSRQLLAAAGDGDLARIKKLIGLEVGVNYQNRNGETPLSFAAAWNQLNAAKLLLRLGADPNLADKSGGTPLMLAAQHGSPELVALLIKHGADVKAKDKAGNTVVMHADWREGFDRSEVRELFRKATNKRQQVVA
jgi:ankyrin repeat protein